MSEDTVVLKNTQDVANYVNRHPRNPGSMKALIFVSLASVFSDSFDMSGLGVGVNTLKAQMQLSSATLGLTTSSMAVGALCSTLLGGVIADRTGRYRLFIICSALLTIAPLGEALSVNLGMLVFFRLLLGVAVGLDLPVALSFLSEIVNSRTRGRTVNMWAPFSAIACIIGALSALPFYYAGVGNSLWRYVVALGAIPGLFCFIVRLIYAEESPTWSAEHQGLDRAAGVLSRLYHVHALVDPHVDGGRPKIQKEYPVSTLFRPQFRSRAIRLFAIRGVAGG